MHTLALRSRAIGLAALAGLTLSVAVAPQDAPRDATYRSWPKDDNLYVRPALPEDFAMRLPDGPTSIFLANVVVNNTDATLLANEMCNDGETSIAVNPLNLDEIVISSFSLRWGNTAPIYHSTDGGITWTRQSTVPAPPGWPVIGPGGCGGSCPCDWTWDYGRNNQLSFTILAQSPTVGGGVDVVTGTATDPAMAAMFNYFDPAGPPVQAQETNINVPNSLGNADQPWILVNADPTMPAQDNVYVAWDDFNNTNGIDGPDMRVAVSYGLNPPNFTNDVLIGDARGEVNPGLRMAKDPRTGAMWGLWGRNVGAGAGGSKRMNYMLNRSTDGGATWTLNGSATGIVVAIADSTQPTPKFGTVNALLGGAHHAAVDPVTGELFYVYGNRDPVTGNNRLSMLRISGDVPGGVAISGDASFVTGQVQAALPQIAVTDNGTIGVFYYTFDGFSPSGFPIFTAHLALSPDRGVTFIDQKLTTFLSSATDSGNPRQRVLGDYMNMVAIGNTFYGSFTANGLQFGRPFANHDPIFFRLTLGPQIQVPGPLALGPTCAGSSATATLNVCNTGTEPLIVASIMSSDPQFVTTAPSSGFPVSIDPGFCFPFQVVFTPTAIGMPSATLTIASNDPLRPTVDVAVQGDAPAGDIRVAGSTAFGNVCSGVLAEQTMTVSNIGACDLDVMSAAVDCADFTLINNPFPAVLPSGASQNLVIRFTPTSGGSKTCTLTITSDDPDSNPVTLMLTANTPTGDIRVTGSTAFGDVCAGDLAEKTVTVSNVGACDLDVMSAAIDCSDFTLINNPFPAILPPGASQDLIVRFTPTSSGPKTCTLTITSDDPDSNPVTRMLTANTPVPAIGVGPDQAFPPTVIQSAALCVSELPFVVANTGSCALTITGMSIVDLPNASSSAAAVGGPEFFFIGAPSFPVALQAGEIVGDGALRIGFSPSAVDRDREAMLTVTYLIDPIVGTEATITRQLCGEGVLTGARVLVTRQGTPFGTVDYIELKRVSATRLTERARDVPRTTVAPAPPCPGFEYHREYGTVSNPIQLIPGTYEVTVRTRIAGFLEKVTVPFAVPTCGFNPNVVVDLP